QRLAPAFVYHTFDWLEPYRVNPIHRWYERRYCLKADLCVNVDRSRARLTQSLYRLPSIPLWLPNFPLRDEQGPARDEGLRAELLGSRGRILIICPSAASPTRLHLELLRAMSLLPEEYRLLTFGGGGTYGQECYRFVESSKLRSRVTFLDPLPYEELV